MSRVDEARRRAAGREVEPRQHSDVNSAVSVWDESRLEAYPREHRGPDEVSSPALENYPREQRGSQKAAASPPVVQSPRSVTLPRRRSLSHRFSFDPLLEGKLVVSRNASPTVVEQYRRLASSLHHVQIDTGLKTVLVTSALPRDGKTLTIANLALTLSGSYHRRVLLIDADLRRPSVHGVFCLPKTPGLVDALRPGSEPNYLELSPLLSVLPAGEIDGDPLAVLTSDRFAGLLDQCAAAFDWVLLDGPPVGLMPDGNVLARLTKSVVFVISAGKTPYRSIERAIAEVGRESIIGTVLNRIDEESMSANKGYEGYEGYASAHRRSDGLGRHGADETTTSDANQSSAL